MNSYVSYHVHSDYSLLDSTTQFSEYIELAKRDGYKAIGTSEHGMHRGYLEKYLQCKQAGIKLLIGCEIYLTERLEPKVRDNYHTVLIAKNLDGLHELNRLVAMSTDDAHFYYNNRISFDEFLQVSDNIIKTSACLASPLNKLDDNHPMYMRLARHYDYLEVQPHNCQEQADFNRRLLFLSQEIGKPLIAGTDTHNASAYKAECRAILLKRKGQSYGNEDTLNLNWRTYDELVEEFHSQGALPEQFIMQAIDNTNVLADSVEDFTIDTSIKYPILYGSPEEDARRFSALVEKKFAEKLDTGVIPPEQKQAFRSAIDEEMRVFNKIGMAGFMLSMSEILSWCKEQGMAIGTARGSVGGSRVAYVADIIDMNPETWHTVFSRFCNEDRVEPGDIDTDVVESDRPLIFQHIQEKFGLRNTARVASYGTIADLAFIDDVGGAFAKIWTEQHPNGGENPWSLENVAKIKELYSANPEEAKSKYPDMFYYFDGLTGTKVSQSVHPAGMVISPIDLDSEYGIFYKDGERCLLATMDDAHEVGLVKYDFLILSTVQIIRDTCRMIGKPYPKTNEIDWNDPLVWADMLDSPLGVFQMESGYAYDSLKKFKPHNIFDMSLVTAAIRPSGASYRDDLLSRKTHHNPSAIIDDLLKDNRGYLIYQEDVIAFLQQICGLSGSSADTVRRGIAKKKMDVLEEWLPRILDGYCEKSDKQRAEAEQEAQSFLQVIQDASAYMFGYNHSIAYCLLGYLCAYYRYYYPVEFIAAELNVNSDKEEKTAAIMEYAQNHNISVFPPRFGYSRASYNVDKEHNSIYKGVASIKYMNAAVADALYDLSKAVEIDPLNFTSILKQIKSTGINSRQLEILISLDYFEQFGNSEELTVINNRFNYFKCGEMKTAKKEKLDSGMAELIARHATDKNAKGQELKSFTITDMDGLLAESEQQVRDMHLPGYTLQEKAKQQLETLGYIDLTTRREEDRRKLFITDMRKLKSKDTGAVWGITIFTRSVGSGKIGRLTVRKEVYDAKPFEVNDIVYASQVYKNRAGWWYLDEYEVEI